MEQLKMEKINEKKKIIQKNLHEYSAEGKI